jgi:16S rRNA (cytidine1402-2'-O)-methyltransferase
MAGKLYVVGTPIGNLADLTFRAVDTLKAVDAVLCEDTRSTVNLLNRYQIRKPLLVYTEHAHDARAAGYLDRIAAGETMALVSEAGMPALSDPGARLVEEAHRKRVAVESVPGPSAVTAALSVAGFPAGRFIFEGFLPRRPGRRRKLLRELAAQERTVVIFESPHRIARTLQECSEAFGSRPAAVVRELTKIHEQVIRGDLAELAEAVRKNPRGEFTLVIAGTSDPSPPAGAPDPES